MEFSAWSLAARTRIEQQLSQAIEQRAVKAVGHGDAVLYEAMRYGLLGGGKRIRALLALAAGEAVGAPTSLCETVGAAIECIHAFSLVHDDMPCMDDDDLRRGQPTVHVKYGEAQALLVGDALQTLGFELISEMDAPPETVIRLVRMLAQATGAAGMAGGQAVDIEAVGKSMTQTELERMHALKTGALISASVEMGAACARVDAARKEALARYAAMIGLAFQVADDVLDVSADAQTLGKTPGKDAAANKPTFVALLGLNGARDYASGLVRDALAALEPHWPVGAQSQQTLRLRELAKAVVERSH